MSEEKTKTEYEVSELKAGNWVVAKTIETFGRKAAATRLRKEGYKREGGTWRLRRAVS